MMNELLKGGLITRPESALALAEVIVVGAYGEEELERQKPFVVADEDDRWHVAGSFNQDRQCDQSGPVSLWIRKSNAAVIDISLPFFLCVPPDVEELIDREMERRERLDEGAR